MSKHVGWLALAVLTGVVMLTPGNVKLPPRGIRNKNPGNLRDNGIQWDGLSGSDGEFYQFQSAFWGLRALARVLRTYRNRYDLTTPRELIYRYAPPSENDSEAYARHVAAALGVGVDDPLPGDDATLARLVETIVLHENGMQPYSKTLIRQAVEASA